MATTPLPALSHLSSHSAARRTFPFPPTRTATRTTSTTCSAKKKKDGASFTDRILDYIEGGPKLRKWYGAPDLLPVDGGSGYGPEDGEASEEEEEEEENRDAVLVTNGDSEMGQMVILSLILKRARIKAIVKDKRAAIDAFGTYVEALAGDARERSFFTKALRGVRAIICPSHEEFFSNIGQMKGIEHIILLSQLAAYRGSSGFQAFLYGKMRALAERDEEVVVASGIAYTIIRGGMLQDSPGGIRGFNFEEGAASKGKLCKEDAARICAEALDVVPQRGLILEVANGEQKVSDWREIFTSKIKNEEQM